MHDSSKEDESLLSLHESMMDAFESLLSFFGDLTALTADDQYLAQSHHSEKSSNDLISSLNEYGLLQVTMELFSTFK